MPFFEMVKPSRRDELGLVNQNCFGYLRFEDVYFCKKNTKYGAWSSGMKP